MIENLLSSFSTELLKLAAGSVAKRAESFHEADSKNWPGFEKDLKSKAFQKAMLSHPETDSKLKKYVQNYGGQLKSKSVISVAPSRSEKDKKYKIKVLPSGRLSCECKDWQYKHSVKKSDCDHIKAVRHLYKAGLVKTGSVVLKNLAKAVNAARRVDMADKAKDNGFKASRKFHS